MTLMQWASTLFCSLVGLCAWRLAWEMAKKVSCALAGRSTWRTSWRVPGWAASALFTSVVFLFAPQVLRAQSSPERFGKFEWLSPWIETGGTYLEPRDGRFQLFSAKLGGRWVGSISDFNDGPSVEAQVAFGTRSLVARPQRYSVELSQADMSHPVLTDAFAGVQGAWGRLRIGLLPLKFGLEEGDESVRTWVRPLILRRGLIGLRDTGLHYSVSSGGFLSDWFVHNGEGGEDLDRELWMTARWEYRLRTTRVQWRWGASGQVGRTAAISTHPSGSVVDANVELDVDEPSRLRFASMYMSSDWMIGEGQRGDENDRRFGFELELFGGEVLQDIRSRRLRSARVDFHWDPTDFWGLFVRGEAFDPDAHVSGDMTHEVSFGIQRYFLRGSMKRSLRGLLVATKEWVENRDQDRHRAELILRFSPDLLD